MKKIILCLIILLNIVLIQAQDKVEELRKQLPESVKTLEEYQFVEKILLEIYEISEKREDQANQEEDSILLSEYKKRLSLLELNFKNSSKEVFISYKKAVESNRYLEFLEVCTDESFKKFLKERAFYYNLYKKEKFRAYEKHSSNKIELLRLYKKESYNYYLSYKVNN